uniref:Bromodomain adjacent to zinc finger domain 2B n=1 Tax=Poecilia latipinna TaxID=48699 RepID=A0A3B3VN41_9TELE
MESGERLASPAPTLSASSLAPSPSALGSTLNTSGRLFGGAGDQPFIGSTLSSAFPLVNHPAFGALYTAGAGRPEFGGLGSIGMSAALAAHPQLGALTEWWRAAEAHGRGAAAFIPSFIGFPPFFAPHIQPNHNTSPVQIRTPGKNSHDPPKGTAKSRRKPAGASLASHSESGTSSDSSSDGSLSSDLEDLAEEDEDEDDDEEDDEEDDKQSELSESEKRIKKKAKDNQAKKVPSNPPTLVPLPCSVSPPTLSQTSPLGLQSSRTRTEGPQQHFSVIQSTGLAANPKPLALLTQPRREPSPTSSPIALTTSPRALRMKRTLMIVSQVGIVFPYNLNITKNEHF